jgi:hypothetical protein
MQNLSEPGFDQMGFKMLLYSVKWLPFIHEYNENLAAFKQIDAWQVILDP